jgi:hypothetical protein
VLAASYYQSGVQRGEARDRNYFPHVENLEPSTQRGSKGCAGGALSLAAKHTILPRLGFAKLKVNKSEFEGFHGRAPVRVAGKQS